MLVMLMVPILLVIFVLAIAKSLTGMSASRRVFVCVVQCNDGYSGDGIDNCVRTAGPVISLKGTNPVGF